LSDKNNQAVEKDKCIEPSNKSENESPVVFQLSGVTKSWPSEQGFDLTVPKLTIHRGEKVALVGDNVEEFTFVTLDHKRLNVAEAWRQKNKNKLAQARMRSIGYVLQTGGLLPFLSVYDNIGLSLYGLGQPAQEAVKKLAVKLGIERHLQKYPMQLSVGERQRVAIARAMAHEPSVVIADEPTASLDPINATEVMGIFTQIADEKDVTFIVATHEWERVKELGFRRIKFSLDRDPADGTVRAKATG